MKVHTWFYKQNLLLQISLLLLPFVGYISEVLIRLSIYLEKKNKSNLIIFIVMIVLGIIFCYVDLVYFLIKGNLILNNVKD